MSLARRLSLVLLAAFYLLSGVCHVAFSDFYLALMPPYLPWHLELVFLSGIAEIGLGVAILIHRLRILAAWGIIALLIAVFPANLHAAMADVDLFGTGDPGPWNWIRLPFQAFFIAWAWWHTRPDTGVGKARPR
ncbi:MAG: DoxX family protein [Proteobacteria bacterium]|nr:DoxX family protein [Pseudomonadota bacterium]